MLPVFYENGRVGQIEESGHGISFAYDPEWLNGDSSFAISVSMPLRHEPYSPELATPWFANLLPEDRQLEQISRLLGRSQSDVYGLLEEIGRETAGALSIGGPEPIEHADYRDLSDKELSEVIQRLPERPLLAGEQDVTMSLAGAQTKLAVAVFGTKISLPLHGAASTHILKPESERLHATVENELLSMRLAERLKLQVAHASVGIAENRRYLLVQRFDRKVTDGTHVRRKHQEDFCQTLGLYPTQKYETRRGPGFKKLFEVINQYSRRSARDRLSLLDLAIFSCCIGDTDRHGKNFSLMLTGTGAPRLAPGYDLMSGLSYDGITRNLAMKIAGKNRAEYLGRRHWERFAKEVGLSPAATIRRVNQLGTAVADEVIRLPSQLAEELPADRDALKLFASNIQQQATRVATNAEKAPSAKSKDTDYDEGLK